MASVLTAPGHSDVRAVIRAFHRSYMESHCQLRAAASWLLNRWRRLGGATAAIGLVYTDVAFHYDLASRENNRTNEAWSLIAAAKARAIYRRAEFASCPLSWSTRNSQRDVKHYRLSDSCVGHTSAMKRLCIFLSALVMAVLENGVPAAFAEPRLALVIANQKYISEVGELRNPHKDAALIKASLEKHGFEVMVLTDKRRVETLAAVEDFSRNLDRAGPDAVGFFYYTGHGAAEPGKNRNYIIPIDVKSTSSKTLWHESVRLEEIRRLLNEGAPQAAHVVVFDACRSELKLPTKGPRKGFVAVGTLGGMLTAFSASPNEEASDGESGDEAGPYALALAAELVRAKERRDGVTAAGLFGRVRLSLKRSGASQGPIFTSGLDREVVFGGGAPVASANPIIDRDDTWTAEESDIRAAQRDLHRLRLYDGEINGEWSDETARALERFQRDGEIVPANGKLTEATLNAIRAAPDPPPVTRPGDWNDGEEFRECDLCPWMKALSAGSFRIGSDEAEAERDDDEGPLKRISIARFALGHTEVTRAEYEAFVSATQRERKDGCWGWTNSGWAFDPDRTWLRPGFAQSGSHPVVCVSWDDANAFVTWLNEQVDGEPYRLPSEAELEYAIRANSPTTYNWDGNASGACDFANGADYSMKRKFPQSPYILECDDGHVYTAPALALEANAFELSNMVGNVMEWTSDCWSGSYDDLPSDGSPSTAGDCQKAPARGGSWVDGPVGLRSANREALNRNQRIVVTGFRVARSLSAR